MKKIISIITLLFTLSMLTNNIVEVNADSKKTYFRVTAYYSPLPDQNYYIKGNYWAEKRMNWEWIRWASGKPVFSGMLAAPKNYAFWTKIELKWLWIWEVADRGGAIVKAWERNFKYDRIDIWVWYWDEGLRRAMYWGNRVIEWTIISSNSKVNLNYNTIPAPTWAIPKTRANNTIIKTITKVIEQKTDFELKLEDELKIFEKKVETDGDTKILQERLKKLGLYKWKIDWNYNNITEIISKYQLDKELIKKLWDAWTWYFWPKTRLSLKQDYKELLIKEKEEEDKIKEFEKQLEELKINIEKQATTKLNEIWIVKFWEISPAVRELQITLNQLWYFDHKDTAIFWNKTKQAILEYQLDKKIIANNYELWAWHFWPNTRKQLRNDIADKILLEEISKNKELTTYYSNKIVEVAKLVENKKI